MDNFFGRAGAGVEGTNLSEDGDRRGGREEEEMEEGGADRSSNGGSYGGSCSWSQKLVCPLDHSSSAA